MNPAKQALLSAQHLNRSFGAVVAASDITIDIATGERLCLIGSNGAGKTTFVNMITGYLKPASGRIVLDGEDITALAPREITRRGVARSFQIPQLCMHMPVLDNMLASLHCSRGDRSFLRSGREPSAVAECLSLLERFDLAKHASRPVMELPGGVRKLLDIAMSLTGHPKLLMLDEPTSGVSAEEKFMTMDTVMNAIDRGAQGRPVTVVFVEHDMDIVERYASRVIAFYSGRVIADGSSSAVLGDTEVQRYVTGSVRPSEEAAA
ncbi:ABC transporter ATP-binding protein [Polaromonas sp. AET17H-212]|uniref:ABC transporter ATP-binding protein n=1 Tax=Polaromonas sp. AET17H-212 TaxID=1977061 RepID=UPI001596C0CA|nr:ABC transporter ATP-binding protein [Polaromonas sp. AET17H-212]